MKHEIDIIAGLLCGVAWLAGIVLAKGFWPTLSAVCLPFYAWYLVIERAMLAAGVI